MVMAVGKFGKAIKQAQDKLVALQAEKTKLVKHSKSILDAASTESRELTDSERETLDANDKRLGEVKEEMSTESDRLRELRVDDELSRINGNRPGQSAPSITGEHSSMTYAVPRQKSKHFETQQDAYASGMWCLATLYKRTGAQSWCQDHGIAIGIESAMSGTNNVDGGFLVPATLESTIIVLREKYGVFRQNAMLWPMASDSTTVPRQTQGLTVYFLGENDDITPSQPKYDAVGLVARKLAASCVLPTELAEDAVIAIADKLAEDIAHAFSKKEDECGFNGDGTSTYGGIVGVIPKIDDGNHTAGIVTAVTGNTAFSSLDIGDFEACVGKLPQYAEDGAAWFISKAGYAASILRLMDAAGGNTMANLQAGGRPQFLGYPVVMSQVMNTTLTAQASTIVALFGNLKMASTFGERRGVTIKSSEHLLMDKDQLYVCGTERFAINNHDLGSTTEAGPMVALKTAAE